MTKTIRPRRGNASTFTDRSLHAFILYYYILALFSTTFLQHVNSAVWTNGPEDRFFCGFKWDDADCQKRQHCPTGRAEECTGFETGIKCFANTDCDTRFGDGDWFTGEPPKQSPSGGGGTDRPTYEGRSEDATDYYWCGVGTDDARMKCGVYDHHCPGGTSAECPAGNICYHDIFSCDARNLVPPTASPITDSPTSNPAVSGPTKIPTYYPIGPPDPLQYPSDDPTDHWWCGIGIDDANAKCHVHCPSAQECPMGHICYFGTQCDARTHMPTPPPTRRPTEHPVPNPTLSPTFTMPPTPNPTFSISPTASPSEQGPTSSPTTPPTHRPTHPPMPTLQASFFCGTSWDDAINNCKRRCPTGESTECPFNEKCFSLTPCTEELGYPEGYGLSDPGAGGVGGNNGDGSCVTLKVTIVADHWPKETSWVVENTELGDIVAEANSEDLVPGEPVEYFECVNNRNGCYEFTINDSGGDGICCGHGNGSYKVSYDGVQLGGGNAFYDNEKISFGYCGNLPDTELPTEKPTPKNNPASGGGGGGGGNPGEPAYRCVANALVESGYEISSDKCNLFVDCYNQYIDVGDDFFCNGANEQCVDASACGGGIEENNSADEATAPPQPVVTNPPTNRPTNRPTQKVVASRPVEARPKPGSKPSPVITQTKSKSPTPSPVSEAPTMLPTTYRPTYGPCGGAKCSQSNHCRSPYGFCGPGDTYCNDKSIWTNDCQTPEPSSRPSLAPVSESPTNPWVPIPVPNDLTSPITDPPTTIRPTPRKPSSGAKKPSGGKKPGGGKGSLSKPVRTPRPTDNPITSLPSPRPTKRPSKQPTKAPSKQPTKAPSFAPITPARTNEAVLNPPIDLSEPNVDSSPSETQPNVNTIENNPSADISETNNIASINSISSNDTDEYDCTGEPCPVDTHCRSRYGSCGPGFIYCNIYTIWKNGCPPPDPFRPTKSPTARPTNSPAALVVPKTARPTKSPVKTFPPLAGPTLPTIAGVIPLTRPNSFTANDERAESDEPKTNDANKTETPRVSPKETNSGGDYFQSEGYLEEWASGQMTGDVRRNGAVPANNGHSALSAVMALIFLIFNCID